MQKLKQKLLDTGDFKACEALTKYCRLIEDKPREFLLDLKDKHYRFFSSIIFPYE